MGEFKRGRREIEAEIKRGAEHVEEETTAASLDETERTAETS